MPYKTGIRLLGVARNPANGFPARLLGAGPRISWAESLMGRGGLDRREEEAEDGPTGAVTGVPRNTRLRSINGEYETAPLKEHFPVAGAVP